MRTALGGFIANLDRELKIHDLPVFVPTRRVKLTAKNLRVRIENATPETREGRVSAVVEGAGGSLARSVYPSHQELWDQAQVPEIPSTKDVGTVKDTPFLPGACLPEIEKCEDGEGAKPISLDRPVTSEGFIVHLSLVLVGYEPGAKIRGVVALSDG